MLWAKALLILLDVLIWGSVAFFAVYSFYVTYRGWKRTRRKSVLSANLAITSLFFATLTGLRHWVPMTFTIGMQAVILLMGIYFIRKYKRLEQVKNKV
jgi:CHASE2 domain-containing sensor protein